jgi:hypothetical protein
MADSDRPFVRLLKRMVAGPGGRERAAQWVRTTRHNDQTDLDLGLISEATYHRGMDSLEEAERKVLRRRPFPGAIQHRR